MKLVSDRHVDDAGRVTYPYTSDQVASLLSTAGFGTIRVAEASDDTGIVRTNRGRWLAGWFKKETHSSMAVSSDCPFCGQLRFHTYAL